MKRVVELIIYPLIVGLIVAIVAFGLPLLTKKSKKVEYKIQEPTSYISPSRVGDLDIVINGVDTKHLNSYNVHIENTGELPVSELPIKYLFSKQEDGFRILTEFHRTTPPYEFGEIEILEKDSISLRFNYSLFNPGDIAELTILTTKTGTLDVYSKQEGLAFSEAKEKKNPFDYFEIGAIFLTAIGAFLSTLLKAFEGKKISQIIKKFLS